jgi:hypothetical protein
VTQPSRTPEPDPAAVLAERVHAGGESKPFGEVTREEVHARADELRAATGWGPTARVGPVARAWAELARLMDAQNAATVADLDHGEVAALAKRLWVVPPGGTLL